MNFSLSMLNFILLLTTININIYTELFNMFNHIGCTKNINKCFVKISSDLETKIDNGEITFINPNLPLLCK